MSQMARKHLNRDKKLRAPKHQPICGLFAVARCMGRHLKTAKQVEAFRQECFARKLLVKPASWVGGTSHCDRASILAGFGWRIDLIRPERTPTKSGPTVKRLLTDPVFFKTREQWLLIVDGHCVYVQTNRTKRKLYCMDQRGARMRLPLKGESDARMEKLLRQRVVSVGAVRKAESERAERAERVEQVEAAGSI